MRQRTRRLLAMATIPAIAATVFIVTPAVPAAAQTSIVVDNDSARFTASGDWGTSTWSDQGHGADYRFADPAVGASDAAWYRFAVPATGNYRVDAWHPSDPGYNDAAPYVIVTTGGSQVVHVDQRSGGGGWRPLGTFTLAAGDYYAVGVSRWTIGTGYVIADAVRITPTGGGATGWSLPVPQSALPRSEYDDPHHDYPAIDLPVPTGTPAYAVRSGTVTRINSSSCGLGIRLSAGGTEYVYCHFSGWSVASGSAVSAGQRIGATGNTGNSTGPHLHLQIRHGGLLRCPQDLLLAIYDGTTPPPVDGLPASGCSY